MLVGQWISRTILLHGKKDIFLEKVEYSDKDKVKETEADEFAIKWTY